VTVPDDGELGARAAAVLPAVGVDRCPDLGTAVGAMSGAATTHTPRPEPASVYDALYEYSDAVAESMADAWALRRSVAATWRPAILEDKNWGREQQSDSRSVWRTPQRAIAARNAERSRESRLLTRIVSVCRSE